ncbi:hypothetical protein B566_EDAN006291, partial [Ephemera danica]
TKFAGSSCNDVVTWEAFSFISGHFDKRIRFWDARCDGTLASGSGSVNDIVLQGRVTSLDLSKGHPNGQLVSAGGADGAVFVWSAASGRLVCESNNREHG